MASVSRKSKFNKSSKDLHEISSNEEFSTKWDIDFYKTDHESDEHWELRRKFMVAYKDKFPEDQLVCLAQVFVNMEFMGCKYPSETMRMVAELSKDVAKDFRDGRKGRLKRTFVTASDAAEQKAKAMVKRTTNQEKKPKRICFESSELHQDNKPLTMAALFENLPYKNFILTMHLGRNAITCSARRNNIDYREEEDGQNQSQKSVKIFLDNKFVAEGSGDTLKVAKTAVFNKAVEVLQKSSFCLKPNPKCDTIAIKLQGNKIDLSVTNDVIEDQKIDPNNKGYKMLKLMGWTGGGLGLKTQGREEPVSYLLKNNREGLGNKGHINQNYFQKVLMNYVEANDIRELDFDSSFTKEDRSVLHTLAVKFGLFSKSYGKGSDRHLVIKKKFSDVVILEEILLKKNPVFCKCYLVQVPESLSSKFPEHTQVLQLSG